MAKHIQLRADDDQRAWNFLFAALYVLILGIFALSLKYSAFFWYSISTFGLFEMSILALAAFRLTRLVVYDEIMFFFRSWFMDRKRVEHEDDQIYIHLTEPPSGPRKALCHLLGCPWCTGVWAALFTTIIYFGFVWGWVAILVLAVAGVATLLQLFANFLGWRAEGAKQAVQGHDHA